MHQPTPILHLAVEPLPREEGDGSPARPRAFVYLAVDPAWTAAALSDYLAAGFPHLTRPSAPLFAPLRRGGLLVRRTEAVLDPARALGDQGVLYGDRLQIVPPAPHGGAPA